MGEQEGKGNTVGTTGQATDCPPPPSLDNLFIRLAESGHVIPELAGEGIHCDATSFFSKVSRNVASQSFSSCREDRNRGGRNVYARGDVARFASGQEREINCVDSTVEIRVEFRA